MSKNRFHEILSEKVLIKSRNLEFRKSNYIFEISRSRASKLYIICLYFKSLKFFSGAIAEPLLSHFVKIAHKVAKSKYFSNM